jgi:hypothetical protein
MGCQFFRSALQYLLQCVLILLFFYNNLKLIAVAIPLPMMLPVRTVSTVVCAIMSIVHHIPL